MREIRDYGTHKSMYGKGRLRTFIDDGQIWVCLLDASGWVGKWYEPYIIQKRGINKRQEPLTILGERIQGVNFAKINDVETIATEHIKHSKQNRQSYIFEFLQKLDDVRRAYELEVIDDQSLIG